LAPQPVRARDIGITHSFGGINTRSVGSLILIVHRTIHPWCSASRGKLHRLFAGVDAHEFFVKISRMPSSLRSSVSSRMWVTCEIKAAGSPTRPIFHFRNNFVDSASGHVALGTRCRTSDTSLQEIEPFISGMSLPRALSPALLGTQTPAAFTARRLGSSNRHLSSPGIGRRIEPG